MKRSLIISQIAVLVLGFAGTTFAATTAADTNNLKISGEVRYRNEWTKDNDGSPQTFTRARFNLFAPIDEQFSFVGRIQAQNEIGFTTTDLNVAEAYMYGKLFCFDTFLIGRFQPKLGQGLLINNGGSTPGVDGVLLGMGKELNVVVAAVKAGIYNVQAVNLAYTLNPDVNLSASYMKDNDSALWKSYAVGFNYQGIDDFQITGEYGKNDSKETEDINGKTGANGWYLTTKYMGADPATKNSYGFWAGYRNADTDFSPKGVSIPDASALQNNMSDIKGLEIGCEYTVFKNGILKMQYNMLEQKSDKTDSNSLLTSLTYKF